MCLILECLQALHRVSFPCPHPRPTLSLPLHSPASNMTKVLPFVGGVAVVRVGVELVPGVDPSESTTTLPGLPWMILGFLLSIYIPLKFTREC